MIAPTCEKLPPRLAWGKPFKVKERAEFKPVACFRCGSFKFNAKLKMEKKKATRMQLICAECGRKTEIAVKRFE
ncbi:MAG: hypothetical protein N3E51_04735 [Candidatus Micrarchaeota archaeon]|nr:hypothetical protein [Candidatus Micrarchaeota archaeon]